MSLESPFAGLDIRVSEPTSNCAEFAGIHIRSKTATNIFIPFESMFMGRFNRMILQMFRFKIIEFN